MFGLNENTQYYVCQRYVRMNMGINGLYQIVRTEMELPPLGGAVFIFFSKNRQQVKCSNGMAMVSCCTRSDWSKEPLNCHSLTPRTNNAKCRTGHYRPS